MEQSLRMMPVSIEFPSFAPSPQISPAKIAAEFPQHTDSSDIHRISIHLPEEYLDSEEQESIENTVTTQNTNTTTTDSIVHSTANVQVFCRMRPANKSNLDCLKHDSTMVDDGENSYSFDYIFGRNATQQDVYDRIAKRHIDDFFMGRNSTVFAYGQTGSGKTYTMFGNLGSRNSFGLIPRTL